MSTKHCHIVLANIFICCRDAAQPINVVTGLDYWLDNLMCNVPEVAMCYHDNGFVKVRPFNVSRVDRFHLTCYLSAVVHLPGRINRGLFFAKLLRISVKFCSLLL